jgi:phage/plasmid-like protein (TIGR03299 family)
MTAAPILIPTTERVAPWQGLGVSLPEGLTAAEAIRYGGYDWQVEKFPAFTEVTIPARITEDGVAPETVEMIEAPGRVATVRRHPDGSADVLGIGMTRGYTIVQNIETAETIQAAAGLTGATFATIGGFKGGNQMFVQMYLPDSLTIGGRDLSSCYLTAVNSHDGTSALTFTVGTLRMGCFNQNAVNQRTAVSKVSFRHTAGIASAMSNAGRVLGLTRNYIAKMQSIGDVLVDTPMSRTEFGNFVDKVFIPQENKTGKNKGQETTRTVVRREALFGLWSSATQENIAGTRWGAYNAVTEYVNWAWPVKGSTTHAERVASGGGDLVMGRAMDLLLPA